MKVYWTDYALYFYFKMLRNSFCLRFIPIFHKFSKDKRRLSLWGVNNGIK